MYKVAPLEQFEELKPKFLALEGLEIAVYKWKDRFFAYSNNCPHLAGPACEGVLQEDVEYELDAEKRCVRKYSTTERYNIVCPWHAIDYDLETGVARVTMNGKQKLALRRFDVFVENGNVLIQI
jgi:nitrite reductase/ring-hydroxylating ferredoxin subunit